MTLLQAFNWFVASDQSQKWCDENYVNWSAAQEAYRVREQLEEIIKRVRLPIGYADDAHQVERALLAGYFRKAVRTMWPGGFQAVSLRGPGNIFGMQERLPLQMRRDCVFNRIPPGEMAPPKPPAFLVAHKLFRTTRGGIEMRYCTAIEPAWLTDPSLVPAAAIERLQLVQEAGVSQSSAPGFSPEADNATSAQSISLVERMASILVDATSALPAIYSDASFNSSASATSTSAHSDRELTSSPRVVTGSRSPERASPTAPACRTRRHSGASSSSGSDNEASTSKPKASDACARAERARASSSLNESSSRPSPRRNEANSTAILSLQAGETSTSSALYHPTSVPLSKAARLASSLKNSESDTSLTERAIFSRPTAQPSSASASSRRTDPLGTDSWAWTTSSSSAGGKESSGARDCGALSTRHKSNPQHGSTRFDRSDSLNGLKADGDEAEDDARVDAPAVEDKDYFEAKEGGEAEKMANCISSAAPASSAQEAQDRELAMRLTLEAMGLAPTRENFELLAAQLTHDFGTTFTSRH